MNINPFAVGTVTVSVGLIVLALSACGDDAGSPPQIVTLATPTPRDQITPTPTPTFQPTVGMLASAPISRMPMECFLKEAVTENGIPYATAACEAADDRRVPHIIAWKWPDAPEVRVTAYLIYFEELSLGDGTVTVCDELIIDKETRYKVRGDTLEGICSRHRLSRIDAIKMVKQAAGGWTSYSGLSKRYPREEFDGIFELLKR